MSEPVPPPYSQVVGEPGYETKGHDPAYPPQNPGYPPQNPGYPTQQQPPAGYQGPPPAGYQGQPPPGGYQATPPPAGYPQPPPQQSAYPQPGYGYQPQTTTVVVGQPTNTAITTVVHQSFRDYPVQTTCPNCQNSVTTVVRKEPGAFAWILCLIIAFFGGWMGCCLIPFCVDGCQDCTHTCPVCQYQLSHYNRM